MDLYANYEDAEYRARPDELGDRAERDGGRQSERTAQYRCVVSASDGSPAVTAEARKPAQARRLSTDIIGMPCQSRGR